MKVIKAPEEYRLQEGEISVFLAGGITNCATWQDDVAEYLGDHKNTDKLVLFNPRRDNFPINDPTASYKQIGWEFRQLEQADIFSMYFCAGESLQPICMYELGRNILRMQMRFPTDWYRRIVITVEDGYKRATDVKIQTRLAVGEYASFGSLLNIQGPHSIGIFEFKPLVLHAQNIYFNYLNFIKEEIK